VHGLDVGVGEFGGAVDLPEEDGLRPDDRARGLGFGGADPRRFVEGLARDPALAAR